MADSENPSPGGLAGPFVSGHDPRRHTGGKVSKELLEVRRLLEGDAPAARTRLIELMASEDQNVALRAVCEVLDRTLGKPRASDADTEANVRAHLAVVFAGLRERLSPEQYAVVLEQVSGMSQP